MLTEYRVKKEFLFSEATGVAMVELKTKIGNFIGSAYCHPQDNDFMSEKTGYTIAENRAWIRFYQHIKNYELLPQLKILEHLENGVKAKEENDRNGVMIFRAANAAREELKEIHNIIEEFKRATNAYIDAKEELYQTIRAKRNSLGDLK